MNTALNSDLFEVLVEHGLVAGELGVEDHPVDLGGVGLAATCRT